LHNLHNLIRYKVDKVQQAILSLVLFAFCTIERCVRSFYGCQFLANW
jgi:hypothetical protein